MAVVLDAFVISLASNILLLIVITHPPILSCEKLLLTTSSAYLESRLDCVQGAPDYRFRVDW